MNIKILGLAVIVAAAGYVGYIYLGDSELSEEDVLAGITAQADEINNASDYSAEGWPGFAGYPELRSAEVDGMTLRIEGKTLVDFAELRDDFLQSRILEAAAMICSKEENRAISNGGATYILNWVSKDGVEMGTVTAAPGFCEAQGYF